MSTPSKLAIEVAEKLFCEDRFFTKVELVVELVDSAIITATTDKDLEIEKWKAVAGELAQSVEHIGYTTIGEVIIIQKAGLALTHYQTLKGTP